MVMVDKEREVMLKYYIGLIWSLAFLGGFLSGLAVSDKAIGFLKTDGSNLGNFLKNIGTGLSEFSKNDYSGFKDLFKVSSISLFVGQISLRKISFPFLLLPKESLYRSTSICPAKA